ncbi:substrate-binding domain-containing protein [Microlunatus soli]|nr:substrate-binding domain-containing protein [Microlunatus soli]
MSKINTRLSRKTTNARSKIGTGIGAVAAAVGLLAVSACTTVGGTAGAADDAPSAAGKKVSELKVGLLSRQLDAPFYTAMTARAKELAKKEGFTLVSQNANGDPVAQVNQAQTMMSQGVDLMIVDAISPSTEKTQLKQIAGEIPLVFMDTGIPDVGVTSVTSDNAKSGELSGGLTAKRFGSGKSIDVAILNGGPNDEIVGPARQKGFLKGLKDGGVKYKIIASTSAVYAQDKAVPATESLLAAHPDVDLILGLNDSMALGALTVIQDQKNDHTLVAAAADGQKQAFQQMIKGCDSPYVSTGLNSPELAVDRAFEIGLSVAAGESKPDDYQPNEYTKAAGIDCHNVKEYYDPNSVF